MNTLSGPSITASKTSTTTNPVTINISSAHEGSIYYSINNGPYKPYTGSFEVSSNCYIKSYYIRESDGLESSTSLYRVSNIRNTDKPTVIINATPNPYSSTDLADEVTVTIKAYDYDIIEYSYDNIYFRTYKGPFKITNNATIYARAKNYNGYGYDELVINNLNPIKPTTLDSEILINPTGQNKSNSVNEVKVSLVYDKRATNKLYKKGNSDSWHEYTGPFTVIKNTVIYLYEEDDLRGTGYKTKKIDFLPEGLVDPIIKAYPSNSVIASEVEVVIEYDSAATVKQYSIDGGPLQDYTGPIVVDKNYTTIYAYSKDINGNVATSTYTITNIHLLNKVVLDEGMYYLIKLNYPSTSKPSGREYKYGLDGEWKSYPSQGILLIKPEYKDQLLEDGILVLTLKDDDGKNYTFNGDWYIIDDNISTILANIAMRWNAEPPAKPIINPSTTDWTSKLEISIDYVNKMEQYLYKIVYKDGRTTGWLDYEGPFEVNENGATIYAKAMDELEVWSDISEYSIKNIDDGNPGVRYMNVLSTSIGTIKVSVEGLDNESGIKYYYYSTDNDHYNVSNSNEIIVLRFFISCFISIIFIVGIFLLIRLGSFNNLDTPF